MPCLRWLSAVVLVWLSACDQSGHLYYRVTNDLSFTSDTCWQYEVSVDEALLVPEGRELCIEPGTEVRFGRSGTLRVEGMLRAIGTADSPIVLRGEVGSPGLILAGGSSGHRLRHIQGTQTAISIEGAGVDVFRDVELEHSETALIIDEPDSVLLRDLGLVSGSPAIAISGGQNHRIEIRGLGIEGADQGVLVSGGLQATLDSLRVRDWRSSAIEIRGSNLSASGLDLRAGRGPALMASSADISVDGLVIRTTVESPIYLDDSSGSITNADVRSGLEHGAVLLRSDMVVASSSFEDLSDAAFLLNQSALEISDVAIQDVDLGISAVNSVVLAEGLRMLGGYRVGVEVSGTLEIRESLFEDGRELAIDATEGDMTLVDIRVQDHGSGIHHAWGDGLMESVTIQNIIANRGVRHAHGDLVVRASTIDTTYSQGIAKTFGDLDIADSVISNTRSYGISQQAGSLVCDSVIIDTTQNHGIYVDDDASAEISQTEAYGSTNYGAYLVGAASVSNSSFHDNQHGIYLDGASESLLEHSDIRDNIEYGVQSQASVFSDNNTDVLRNNIVGNGREGIRSARRVADNYVAENNGSLVQTTSTGGVLDGTRDTDAGSPRQIRDADIIESHAVGERADAGLSP